MNEGKSFVRMPNGIEYSGDYDFFMEHQICICVIRTGTRFISRMDGKVFISTAERKLSDAMQKLLCKDIHDKICGLRYGGEWVE